MADLSVKFQGVEFKNPILLSSAEPTLSFANMKRAIDAGAAGVVAKSFSKVEEIGKQTLFSKYAILNEQHEIVYGKIPRHFTFYSRSGMVPESLDHWLGELEKTVKYANQFDAKVIGSIGTGSNTDSADLARLMEQVGCHMLEVDASCPHPDELPEAEGAGCVRFSEGNARLAKSCSSAVSIPITIKMTPQQADLLEVAQAVMEAGAKGVTLTNRYLGFISDIETASPHIYGWAGVGGPWVLPLTLRWVSKINQVHPDWYISGSNGAYDWRDVVQFIMAGASTVQFCSVVMLKGYSVVGDIIKGLNEFMDRKGYKTIEDMRAISTQKAKTYMEIRTIKERALINHDVCVDCGKCLETCFYEGMYREEGILKVGDKCIGCRLCECVCPVKGAITIQKISE